MTSLFDQPGTATTPQNPFLSPILAYLVSSADSTDANIPADLIATITKSPDPAAAIGQLWDAFYTTVVCTDPVPERYAPHLAFVNALQEHPPTVPEHVPEGSDAKRLLRWYTSADGKFHWSSELPCFHNLWRDTHDVLEAWRYLQETASSPEAAMASAVMSGDSSAPPDHAQCYLRFCTFSAALLKGSEEGRVSLNPMQVFFACLRVLENKRPGGNEQAKPYCISTEQVWVLDVRVAAIWLRDGGRCLWNTDQQELREEWAAALDEPTDLWQKEDGLTRARWQFWATRLQELSGDSQSLDSETRAAVAEALQVVKSLLEENLSACGAMNE